MFHNSHPLPDEWPHVVPPRPRRRFHMRLIWLPILLSIVVLSGIISGLTVTMMRSHAAAPSSPPASMTFQQFLKQKPQPRSDLGTLVRPQYAAPVPISPKDQRADYTHLPPSAEPPKMQPINQVLDSSVMAGGAGATGPPLKVLGSDNRLEVQILPGSLDLSQATVSTGTTTSAATGTLTLQLTQLHGHASGQMNLLGGYQLQIMDAQKRPVSNIHLLKPVNLIYHYQPWELSTLGLDPDHLVLTWPSFIAAAQQAKQPTSAFVIPMTNDAQAHTLMAQSTMLGPGPFDAGVGDPQNQSPAVPHLASVGGNAGQLSYSYPLQVPPGPADFAPNLSLNYSSSDPNERHSRTSPAGSAGDGWTLSLGSINAEVYPNGSASSGTWYFLSGISNVGDRLIQDTTQSGGTFYQTEHISHLRIQQITSSITNQPCFNIWDTSGTYYQAGCTADSLQYRTDSGGRHNYRWDVNRIMAPNEGPNGSYKLITVSYQQDVFSSGGYTSIRDAGMKQIVYGYGTSISTIGTVVGTVDLSYYSPAYFTNYNCSSPPPTSTTLRCDDPLTYGGVPAPTVMSTLTLHAVTSYVGSDSSSSNQAYGYTFGYQDTPFTQGCYDSYTLAQMDCAGDHLLTSITPMVYQNGTGHTLKQVLFGYSGPLQDVYYDSQHTTQNGSQPYGGQTFWQYLTSYVDTNTGVGGLISYKRAFSNTHGTPDVTDGNGIIIDDRHDPLYCTLHTDCTGNYLHPEDHAWSEQVVTQTTALGKDSSASGLQAATTTYSYRLAVTGQYTGSSTDCYPYPSPTNYPPGENDCVGDNWIPASGGVQDSDWQDYFHSEYHGFNVVYTTSPAGDLTVSDYYSTEGWGTPNSNSGNYNSGHMYEQDVYQGTQAADSSLLQKTVNTYTLNPNSCNGNLNPVYNPCEVMVLSSRTTQYEGTGSSNANAPWAQHSYSYDDYSNTSGLIAGYHNLTQDQITSSNAPTLTKKWTYTPDDYTDTAHGNWVYYIVDKATHSEVDDSGGHVWQCHDTTYDEGAARTPSAGWPTTSKAYSTCGQSGSAITSYAGYDAYGNAVATVDGVAVANSSLYSSKGCTFSSGLGPVFFPSSAWTAGKYTTCTTYKDSGSTNVYESVQLTSTNAFGQQSSLSYDYTQGALPTGATDINGQQTTTSQSYDSNGNSTVNEKNPLEAGSYTNLSSTLSNCANSLPGSTTLPCYETDEHSSLYSGAVTHTFYDSLGREIETRTKGPSPSLDLVVFTVYNDSNHSTFESVSFEVQSTLNNGGWVDPNGAVDYQSVAPGGTVTFYDALDRPTGTQDPLYGSSQEPGIACPGLQGTWTTCTFYRLGSANGNTATYFYAAVLDPNNHGSVGFSDALGRLVYTQHYSGTGLASISTNITTQKAVLYNVLNEPTSVQTTDVAPQSGQSITSVTASNTYDDLGRLVTTNDPDRGSHTYTYDANGHMLTDTSGTRTIGYNLDLLERIGCVQDATPTINATGACTSGSHPYVQNTYDTTTLGTQGTNDFPVGELTQSLATTYYPDGTQATVTQNMQHDQRGRVTTETQQLTLPSGWNVTTALPTNQIAMSYNDADQMTTTTTSTNPAGQGYTTTQVYDSTTGMLTGLSNNTTATANLATVSYNARGLEDTVSFQTTTGTALAAEQFGYDANLRPISSSATWQSGSGNTVGATIFSQNRSYDVASNVISVSTTQAAVPGQTGSGGSATENFCYDEQNRLVWAGNGGTQPSAGSGTCGSGTLANSLSGAGYSSNFVYTHLGQNWQGPLNGSTTQYQYLYCNSSHPHQLDGLYPLGTTCATKSGAVYTSSYDSWGNVTTRFYSGTTATLSYDGLDHFTQWNAGTNNQEWYVYDALGNRVLRRSTNGSGTTLTTYAFGIEEHSYSSTGTNQGNKYYYSLGGRLIGELNGTATTFFLTDALGSVLSSFSATAGSAVLNGNQVYAPYGKQIYHQGSLGTSKGYTGQYNDSLTGLDYYNARYYDPIIGRFLSADTVEGNLQGMDPYAYASENPETLTDPSGLCGVGSWGDFGDCFSKVGQTVQSAVQTGAQSVYNGVTGNWEGLAADTYDWFVNPWRIWHNQQPLTQQQTQTQILKPAINAVGVWIAVAVTVAIVVTYTLAKWAFAGQGRSDNKVAEKLWGKTRAQWKKQTNSNDDVNYGGGYLQISGPEQDGKAGKTLLDGQYSYDDPRSPFLSATGSTNHTEKQVVQWAKDIVKQYKTSLTKGGTIRLLIFTRKPPCPACQKALQSEWITDIKQAAGNSNVNVEITVWYVDSKRNTVRQWIPNS